MFSSKIMVSTPIKFIYVIVAVFCLRMIYMMFFRKLTRVEDYIYRSNSWIRFFQMYDRALQVLQRGIQNGDLSDYEVQRLYFAAGIVYSLKRDYARAVECFERLDIFWQRERIDFDPNYYDMLVCYANAGKRKRARDLYRMLLKQEKYDPRYAELRALESRINP
ncbi:MAG: hypothetical protein Q3993_02820 [Filifactor alocis]|nr:hypothetical protein [Filifactor alocis]